MHFSCRGSRAIEVYSAWGQQRIVLKTAVEDGEDPAEPNGGQQGRNEKFAGGSIATLKQKTYFGTAISAERSSIYRGLRMGNCEKSRSRLL